MSTLIVVWSKFYKRRSLSKLINMIFTLYNDHSNAKRPKFFHTNPLRIKLGEFKARDYNLDWISSK